MIPTWFLYLQGFGMLIMGTALIAIRPRKPGDSFYRRYVNLGTLWALACLVAGAGLLAMALGYLSWNAPPPPPAAPTRHVRHR